jgi:GT2 family glycosyltransferase
VKIAVVIGNYQGEDVLPECLESLAAQTLRPTEVIVADGASRDRGREVAREHGARVLELENRGLGYLYNRGAEAAGTEYVLVANNDVAFEPTCLERLAAALDADAERFAADPCQLDWESGDAIHRRTAIRRGSLLRTAIPGLRIDALVHAAEIELTATANAGAMLVRRRHLLELGGFDERFFMEYEDLDLCWRAWLRGWSSVYVPAAVLRHRVGGATSTADLPRRLRSSHRNIVRFAVKCLPPRELATVLAGELVRAPVHRSAVLGGLADALRDLPDTLRERRRLGSGRLLLDWLLAGQPGAPPQRA